MSTAGEVVLFQINAILQMDKLTGGIKSPLHSGKGILVGLFTSCWVLCLFHGTQKLRISLSVGNQQQHVSSGNKETPKLKACIIFLDL